MENFEEVSPPGWKGTVAAMKLKHKDKIDNPYALAWWMKEKGNKPHYKDTKTSNVKTVPPKKKEFNEQFKNSELNNAWLMIQASINDAKNKIITGQNAPILMDKLAQEIKDHLESMEFYMN